MHPLEGEDPRAIGPYRLLRRLGAGGMGRVYLGRSAGGRTVAVKVVHPHFATDEQFRARFRREVESARRVGGRWTAPVLDADPDASVPWVATGYVAGPALHQAVSSVGPLPEHSVRAVGAGLAEALTAVHGLGLVHRDVKPSNVLLTLDGPRLIDFGIARATDGAASLTSTGVSIGSPGYMSPEQILGGDITPAVDVFSLGAVLAFAATGEGPFPGDSSAALLYKVVHEEPELGDELRGGLRNLVAACLAKDPAARPTPEEAGQRLVEESGASAASGVVRSGWLPGPLVEQVSRRAVELLDLDAGPMPVPGAAGPAPVRGPVPEPASGGSGLVTMPPAQFPTQRSGSDSDSEPGFDSGAASASAPVQSEPTSTAGTAGGGGAPGAFGPPHPSFAGTGGPLAEAEDRSLGEGKDGSLAGSEESSGGARRARFSVSASATATSPPLRSRRGRRLSCTLVLSVAAALAVATTTAYFLGFLGLMPGGGGSGGGDAVGDSHSEPPLPDAAPSPGASVPRAFLGTWKGEVVQGDGTPNGDVTITLTKGGKGAKVARLTYGVLGLVCRAKGELVSVTDKKLTLEETGDNPGAAPLCTGTTATVTLTLVGKGVLAYTSDDAAGGRPTSRLTKSGS
ncbi:serine/threonine-protein kinase [Streptomyces sp. 8N706]|uniref:serine/threonine-protein kinase n=1 Tax=Streptomyces sp. 8N706 TaxID=3457416 RepID=UPI003FD5984A